MINWELLARIRTVGVEAAISAGGVEAECYAFAGKS